VTSTRQEQELEKQRWQARPRTFNKMEVKGLSHRWEKGKSSGTILPQGVRRKNKRQRETFYTGVRPHREIAHRKDKKQEGKKRKDEGFVWVKRGASNGNQRVLVGYKAKPGGSREGGRGEVVHITSRHKKNFLEV